MTQSFKKLPFPAYQGDDPYIFASYAHTDSNRVFPEIGRWNSQGYRIWYDEGIVPGNEWPEEVANALDKCSTFVVFISPNSVLSRNVKNEINFALNEGKTFIAVHIEETQLPPGLRLRMGDIQAIMKYRLSEQMYQRQVERALASLFTAPQIRPEVLDSPITKESILLYSQWKYPDFSVDGENYCNHLIRELSKSKYKLIAHIDLVLEKTREVRSVIPSAVDEKNDAVYQIRLALVLSDPDYMWNCYAKPVSLKTVFQYCLYSSDEKRKVEQYLEQMP